MRKRNCLFFLFLSKKASWVLTYGVTSSRSFKNPCLLPLALSWVESCNNSRLVSHTNSIFLVKKADTEKCMQLLYFAIKDSKKPFARWDKHGGHVVFPARARISRVTSCNGLVTCPESSPRRFWNIEFYLAKLIIFKSLTVSFFTKMPKT